MERWLLAFCGVLILTAIFLLAKIYYMRKSAKEIDEAFAERLEADTNTLISISGNDPYMRKLAGNLNVQLRKLRSERHRFQQGDQELKEAVTNISHDLRTPLTAICGYLELLEQEETSDAAGKYLKIIRDRTEVLKQLTEELFRYSLVASVTTEDPFEEIVLNRVLEESISAYYAVLKGCSITPFISIPEEKVIRRLDKKALSRIFGNIISNAVKYSDGDLNICLSESGEILFSNHAPGLDEIQVGKLFDRFYTVETAKKSTGLGLSIAKVLTEQLGGTISARYENELISVRVVFPQTDTEKQRIES